MMNNRRRELPSWTKWLILGISLVIVAVLIFLIILYNIIQSNKTEGFTAVEEYVLNETEIVKIEETMRYHGDSNYHVVNGFTNSNAEQIVFVPVDNKEDITIVNAEDIIPKEKIEATWKKDCSGCELLDIVPAISKDNVLWEITYIDDSERYVINYVSMYDGTQFEEFRFKKSFE